MKNNFFNSKLPLHIILYSVICVLLIRHFININYIPYNNLKSINPETIVTPNVNSTAQSNKSTIAKHLLPDSSNVITLSRGGNVDSFDKSPTEILEFLSYEGDLFSLNEANLIDSYRKKRLSVDMSIESQILNAHLPDYLMYRAINVSNLKDFLISRNSVLAEEPYLSTIISVSKDFNLNPLVMFAITGQEQSFVPKTSESAYKIANNPFNVFNSWKKYNTSIEDTSSIAARTIVNLCKNRPDNMDAFTWVNRKYSEDRDWSKAVRSIFKQLEDNVSYCK